MELIDKNIIERLNDVDADYFVREVTDPSNKNKRVFKIYCRKDDSDFFNAARSRYVGIIDPNISSEKGVYVDISNASSRLYRQDLKIIDKMVDIVNDYRNNIKEWIYQARTPRFKAKTTNEKRWVYGYYLKRLPKYKDLGNEYKHFILYELDSEWDASQRELHAVEIIHKTLCQKTGLYDSEQRSVYEGDILTNGDDEYIVVFYKGQFVLVLNENLIITEISDLVSTLKVIGNIHDDCD